MELKVQRQRKTYGSLQESHKKQIYYWAEAKKEGYEQMLEFFLKQLSMKKNMQREPLNF